MNSISPQSVPQTWTDQDEQFFRISAALFTPAFCYGASVLLASYDETCEAPTPVADLPIASTSTAVTRVRDGVAR